MCSYCPTIVKDNISSLLYSVDKYSNRTYTNGRDTILQITRQTTITNNIFLANSSACTVWSNTVTPNKAGACQ